MDPTRKEQLLLPHEVCDRYRGKLTIKALANMRSLGNGPAYMKIGRRIFYPTEDLRIWEAARIKSKAGNAAAPSRKPSPQPPAPPVKWVTVGDLAGRRS